MSMHDPYSTDSGSDFDPKEIDADNADGSSSDSETVTPSTSRGKRKRRNTRNDDKHIAETINENPEIVEIPYVDDDENLLNIRKRISKNAILDGKFFEVISNI